MATKWEINRAVRASSLPAPSRLIMLTLSDIAEVGTAEIPERHTPSLRVLAEETGLSEATVKRHLTALEDGGWILRARPTQDAARRLGERTRYRLTIPEGSEGAMDSSEGAQGWAQSEPTQGSERAQSGLTESHIYKEDNLDDRDDHSSSRSRTKAKSKPKRQAKTEALREDVERICRHLADRMVANGCKRPNIGKDWRVETRRLLDIDKRTEAQVIACIDWATNDPFWRKNILSMPKLREKYEQLRLGWEEQRDRQRNAAPNQRTAPASTAPTAIPSIERCPEHRDQRAGACRHCAARAKAGMR